ncbi:MAG: putative sulfate exporter family transporter [Bacillota bacterium]
MLRIKQLMPGIILCFVIMVIGSILADYLGKGINYLQGLDYRGSSPISGIFMAVLLGLCIRNTFGLHERLKEGVMFSIRWLLKLGIILLGIRLSFFDVIKLGSWGIPIILASVLTGLGVTLWITSKLHQSQRLGVLTAVGTSICGITAIMGTSPGIRANDEEIAYAIANITLFGIIAMFFYPYLAFYVFQDDPIKVGLFLGTAIHETSQVVGAALIYDQVFHINKVIDTATITKLTRNTLLILIVPIMSYYYVNIVADRKAQKFEKRKWYSLIPLFVLGFMAMAVVRTLGDAGITSSGMAFGLLEDVQWKAVWTTINNAGSKYMLGIAMAGIGLSTGLTVFKGLGLKPFYIGMAAALSVTAISLLMVHLLGGYINI